MKVKSIIIGAFAAISLSAATFSVAGHAGTDSYYPPERIHCVKSNGTLNCEGFNHAYLVEDTYTADFDDKDQVFNFSSGAAYYNAERSEATIFFTYRNSANKNVKLKTANTSMRPDYENGNWTRIEADLYVCTDGYMHCPITALPDAKHIL